MKYKIYVVGPAVGYANWMKCEIVNNIEEADLVLFTGGEDVTPSLYGEYAHPTTYYNNSRDTSEIKIYEKALKLDKKFIGICRGSQFLCVMSGGKLIQHMSHPSNHMINMYDGEPLEVTSSHHQMMYPFNLPDKHYSILGWTEGLSRMHLGGNNEEMVLPSNMEPEIVYFKDTWSLCIQSHPEWQGLNHPTVLKLQEILEMHLEGTLEEHLKEELV